MVVEKFDGVFNGDHVLFTLVVDFVEHGRERGRLSRTGRPGHQHQAARLIAQTSDDRGQAQRIKALDFPGNGAENGAYRAALVKQVAAKSREILQTERKVELQIFLEAM